MRGAFPERNVLVYVPAQAMADVAEDLSAIFKVGREKTSLALAEEFVDLHWRCFPKATSVFEAGISDTVTYLSYPGSHHKRSRGRSGWWASYQTRRARLR
jgi:transposase-like protein